MGYRSDVALVLKADVYNEIMKEATKEPDDPKYRMLVDFNGKSAVDKLQMNYDYAVLYWEWVKWYEGEEDIDFIDELRGNNDSYFIRVGEDYDDVETSLNGDDYDMCSIISLNRSIEMDVDPIRIGTFNGDKVNEEDPELGEIISKWYELSEKEGDKGSCVVGAGFSFTYKNKSYFMSACSPWQGSMSWEAHKDDIEKMLVNTGATDISYHWGNID